MRTRPIDPRRLDVESFANEAGELDGRWPLVEFERLADAAHVDASPGASDPVNWHVRGETRPVRGGPPQIWLHLRADASIALVCQRCLAPVQTHFEVQRSFQFVADENVAAQLDADSDDDVLALTHSLDLRSLVEDELLLGMPLVPRHDVCPEPLPIEHDDAPAAAASNPFAALSVLKRGRRGR